MQHLTFDHLPQAVYEIHQRIERIEQLLIQISKAGPNSDQILTVSEAAEFLDLSVATIYKMTSGGELPFMKRGKRCYFSKTELLTYLQLGRRKTNLKIEAEADAYIRKRGKLKR